ncbi:sodium/sulphate symporter [Desulforamulus reducens MI-1]|uniref:Sodium-dependent dicarboxylate transporter SdcS n=1 Tax=Desulforamulus reducens (strain ATCC BAA-1160 / DSM 100696 / MI-1) TaxID=349161 RepID=A4J1F7_DESRM|nr:SLC13 family permease [Desulforamulus reducens]ABO48910.1 sodium/sulphate symporter [Desulforamulus reducens MI-1]
MEQAINSKNKNINYIQWAITILVPIIIYLFTPLDYAGKTFLAITATCVILWVFALIPENITGLLIPISFVLFGVAEPEVAFKPWAQILPWLVVAGMILSEVMLDTGLAKRLAYKSLLMTGGSGKGIVLGFIITSFVLPLLVPSSVWAKMFIMAPIGIAICKALDFKPMSKEATGIMLMACFVAISSGFSFQTGDETMVWISQVISEVSNGQITISWLAWLKYMLLPGLSWSVFSILTAYYLLVKKAFDNKGNVKSVLEVEYKEMGSLSGKEIKTLLIVLLILLNFIFETYHKMNAAFIMVALVSLFFIPGISLMKREKLQSVNLWILFFVTGAMSVGMVAGSVGVTKVVADSLLPIIKEMGPFGATMMAFTFGVIMNFIMTPLGAMAAFITVISGLAVQAGIHPLPVSLAFAVGLDIYVFPYEVAPVLYFFSLGYMSLQEAIKVLAVRTVLAFLVVAVVFGGYWYTLGLM